jgi:hypothetical protein
MSTSKQDEFELHYLSDKRSLLSNPGTKTSDLYYTNMNSQVALVECNYSIGRFKQSLPSLNFNSTSQVQLTLGSFIGEVYLRLVLPQLGADTALCRGWGYGMITQISYLWGASNTSYLTLGKQQILQVIAAQCETAEKFSNIMRYAGEEFLTPPVAVAGEDTPVIEANLVLPLPWSSVNGLIAKLPFDATLLQQPITVIIQFDEAAAVYTGPNKPNAFTSATVTVRQGDLADLSDSLKPVLAKEPAMYAGYPFMFHQNEVPLVIQGVRASSGNTCNVRLQNFINSDLLSIYFVVVRNSRLSSNGGGIASPFGFEKITNVNITLNGQVIYNAAGEAHKLCSIRDRMSGAYFQNSQITSAVAPFNSVPVDSYVTFIDFSRVRSSSFTNTYFNVRKIPTQIMVLNFNTQRSDEEYTVFATYVYNGINEVQNQQSNLFFD